MSKIWLFIWRLNPPHIWHINTIKKLLLENDISFVFLWTWKKLDEKNPLNFEKRKKLLEKLFRENIWKKLFIEEIVDEESDENWYKKILEKISLREESFNPLKEKDILSIEKNILSQKDKINFYAWDFDQDSAYKVFKKFWKNKFNFIENSRKESFLNIDWKKIMISSTNFRKYLRDKKFETAKKFTDEIIFWEIKKYFLYNSKKH